MNFRPTAAILIMIAFQFSCSQKKEQKKNALQSEQVKVKDKMVPDKEDKIYRGNANLLTQKDIDEFGKKGYTFIAGNITIGDINAVESSEEDIRLDPLKTIKNIDGELVITGFKNLKSTQGLENIERINGDFTLSGCGLKTFNTLEKLSIINGNLTIGSNDFADEKLTEIKGFNNLIKVDNIYISGNSALQILNAFHKIEKTGTIQIINSSLEKVDSFTSLKTVQSFTVEYSSSLKEVDLQKLETVSRLLGLHENTQYKGKITMPNIRKVNHLYIVGNSNLENYCDFSEAVKQNKIDTLSAYANKINLTKEQLKVKCR